jgi:hypothetical protein
MVKAERGSALDKWLEAADTGGVRELPAFAASSSGMGRAF